MLVCRIIFLYNGKQGYHQRIFKKLEDYNKLAVLPYYIVPVTKNGRRLHVMGKLVEEEKNIIILNIAKKL